MKLYYTIMSNTFFYLGDIASKPLQWDWLNEENAFAEFVATCIYNVYNTLMLKSVYYNDLGDCGVWTTDISSEDDDSHAIYSEKD
jgi:hypothetical protein